MPPTPEQQNSTPAAPVQPAPSLKTPSTAIKIIRIFLLVLIVIGLGLIATEKLWVPRLVSMLVLPQSVPVMASNIAPVIGLTVGTSTKIYTNTEYGFSFQYPSDLVPIESSDSQVIFNIAGLNNLATATLSISVSVQPSLVSNCLVAPKSSADGLLQISNIGTTSINGVPFLFYKRVLTGISQTLSGNVYGVVKSSKCYIIAGAIITIHDDELHTSQISEASKDENFVENRLNQIIQSFQFTE